MLDPWGVLWVNARVALWLSRRAQRLCSGNRILWSASRSNLTLIISLKSKGFLWLFERSFFFFFHFLSDKHFGYGAFFLGENERKKTLIINCTSDGISGCFVWFWNFYFRQISKHPNTSKVKHMSTRSVWLIVKNRTHEELEGVTFHKWGGKSVCTSVGGVVEVTWGLKQGCTPTTCLCFTVAQILKPNIRNLDLISSKLKEKLETRTIIIIFFRRQRY